MGDDEPFPEHMFDIFNVRNVDRAHREAYFLEAIEHYKPDLVILDGIRDLVSDINDGTVAQDMMENLMTKSFDAKKRVIYRLNMTEPPKP